MTNAACPARRRLSYTFALLLAALPLVACAAAAQRPDLARMTSEAARVTITRDDWGIAHIHGHTDADAVFGMIYAQCEDDFPRIERNYLTALGRTAEADGEAAIWADLRQRLFLDPEVLRADYAKSPAWLQALMVSWADGINFYLARHSDVKPLVLTHFEPWMALSFTEGSIGGDIERIDLKKLQAFYETPVRPAASSPKISLRAPSLAPLPHAMSGSGNASSPHDDAYDANYRAFLSNQSGDHEPSGSNGFAISPALTANHHALLLINPHTSFFFRAEQQVTSDEGLNAYGAATWGQFFIYQGFNERAGWMHTSSNVDAVDEFEQITQHTPSTATYSYGTQSISYVTQTISITYKTPAGTKTRQFHTYTSQHGPVTSSPSASKWTSTALMNKPIEALEQSFLRTKAHNYAEYTRTMELFANSSNNTVFADADGDIAYWHGNFIPRRDPRFDYTHPVDGSDPATDWHGLLPLADIPHLLNPASGYLFNVNDSPWNGSGASSLKQSDYPAYVEQGIETARGVHAARVLAGHADFTLKTLLASAYDSYLPWFARTLPVLLKAYDTTPPDQPRSASLDAQIRLFRTWDYRWSADSTATTLAVYWATELMKTESRPARDAKIPSEEWIATRTAGVTLRTALATATARLIADFGTWQVPWGQVNRFERVNGDLQQPFSDVAPSIPVPFTSSLWGSLASFAAKPYPGTKKWYGTSGNSFVAVVEFTPGRVRARAVTAGGESGHPTSPHFNDEAARYASGNLRDVYFYPDQLKLHTERTYKPGD